MNIYIDAPERTTKPPRIRSYVPDIYVEWLLSDQKLIGEAKTAADLERERTRQQISAFLCHLASHQNSILVIATPWYAVNNAKAIVQRLKKINNASSVKTIFLEQLSD